MREGALTLPADVADDVGSKVAQPLQLEARRGVEGVEEPPTDLSPETPATPQNDAMDAYKMVLETVWVDGILDPGEVHLLAKRREELNISFEEHLNLGREMLGGN